MANTTFSNLKINALRRAGNYYNASDATLLSLAGGLVNDCLSAIQALSPDSLYWKDLGNTKACTANQAYIDLTDTDILEILAVYQNTTDTKLKRVDRRTFVGVNPDTTNSAGIPDIAYDEEQVLSAGVNTFRIYLLPTPSTTTTMIYDYRKNARFSADGTSADAEYSPLPSQYDPLIFAMFKPRFLEIIDPKNAAAISKAEASEQIAISRFIPTLVSKQDETYQLGSARYRGSFDPFHVNDTPEPT